MKDFTRTPLNELVEKRPSLRSKGRELGERLDEKSLISEWEIIYDQFRTLREEYKNLYLESHKNLEEEINKAVSSLELWAKDKGIKQEKIREETGKLRSLKCSSGKKANYNDNIYKCNSCRRNISSLDNNITHTKEKLETAKKQLIEYLANIDENGFSYPKNISRFRPLKRVSDLEALVDEIEGFVHFWTAKGRSISIRVEGELEDE